MMRRHKLLIHPFLHSFPFCWHKKIRKFYLTFTTDFASLFPFLFKFLLTNGVHRRGPKAVFRIQVSKKFAPGSGVRIRIQLGKTKFATVPYDRPDLKKYVFLLCFYLPIHYMCSIPIKLIRFNVYHLKYFVLIVS